MESLKNNKVLTRDFLQSHGVQFDGAFWCNPELGFRLTASTKENTWMVTIPELPVGVQQPQPISNYTELLRLMLSCINPFMMKLMNKIQPLGLDNQATMQRICDEFANLFSFDSELKFHLNFSPQGFGVQPNNEYTHTLLSGHESKFEVEYLRNGESETAVFYIARECVSLAYIQKVLSNVDEYEIKTVRECVTEDSNEMVPFFGAGINFVQV